MNANREVDDLTVRIIRDEAGWDAIQHDWNELYDASRSASPTLHFDWLRNWWRVYGSVYGAGGLRIVTVWRGPQCVGALPMYLGSQNIGPLRVRQLRLISTGEAEHEEICPDYLNLLCRPGDEVVCSEIIWREVARISWDYLDFPDLPEDSPLLLAHKADLNSHTLEVVPRGICPVADLSHGFEAYLKCLSPKTRQHARQYLRAADRNGAVFDLAGDSNTDKFMADLIRLHQERWTNDGQPGCFAAARFAEFHRRLAQQWVPTGRAVLARLSHEGHVYGVLYGFISRTKCDFYQSGIARTDTGPFESPGTTANLLLMRALAERGITAYDFLRGSSGYKERLATHENTLVAIRIRRQTLRSAVYRSARLGARVVRKSIKLMSQK